LIIIFLILILVVRLHVHVHLHVSLLLRVSVLGRIPIVIVVIIFGTQVRHGFLVAVQSIAVELSVFLVDLFPFVLSSVSGP